MPSPSITKRVLSLPFTTGLSQKQDERWLEPGSFITADNVVKQKTNTLQKRTGFSPLSPYGTAPGAFVSGQRLGTFRGSLLAVASDQWTSAVYTYEDSFSSWDFVDRIPEVYSYPDRTIASYDGVIREFDTCFLNGVEVHTWLVSDAFPSTDTNTQGTGLIYYCVINGSTGQYIIPPQPILFNGAQQQVNTYGWTNAAPKLTSQGNYIVFGCMSGPGGTGGPRGEGVFSLYLASLDTASPQNGFGSLLQVQNIAQPPSLGNVPYTLADLGAWDIYATPGSPDLFGIVYQQVVGTTNTIQLSSVTVSSTDGQAPILLQTASCNSQDAVYESDGYPYITAFGLTLGALGSSFAAITYAYEVGTVNGGFGQNTLKFKVQLMNWALTPSVLPTPAVDMLATSPGPIANPVTGNSGRVYPHAIAIELVEGPALPTWNIAWGPASAVWEATNPALGTIVSSATAFTCSWSVAYTLFGLLGMWNGQPRVTFGVVPASRWLPNVNGIGYIIGRLISDEQGTYYLFACDSWQDVENTGAGSAELGYYPLRLVSTFAPRLSNVIFQTNLSQKGASGNLPLPPYTQDSFTIVNVALSPGFANVPVPGNFPHCLPHIVSSPLSSGGQVFQSLISISSQDQSQNPSVVSFDFQSQLAYQNCGLGQNTGFACGTPSLTDGARVHEFAFPYYPSIISAFPQQNGPTVYGGGLTASSNYNYIAVFDWVDAKGQLHPSGRSAPVTVVVPASGYNWATIVVTTQGFSGKEKALITNPSSNGPQTQGQTATPITVRLFRTQANSGLYYEVGSGVNLPGQATLIFNDYYGDSVIGINRLLYNQGLDGVQQGSIIDNLTPPGFQCMFTHKNRYFGIDGNNVWYTKELLDGEGAAFNESYMLFSWYDGPGYVTGGCSLDDKIILFKLDRIGYVTGQGPTDDGGNNDYSEVYSIASDTGCCDWRSICVTPKGVYFLSPNGYRMLTRDLQVVPVPNVEDLLNYQLPGNSDQTLPANYLGTLVTSNILHPTENQVVTTLQPAPPEQGTQQGIWIHYDTILDSWTTNTRSSGSPAFLGAISAVVANVPAVNSFGSPGGLMPCYHFMTESGYVYREMVGVSTSEVGTYVDDYGVPGAQSYIVSTIETAWVKAQGIENFARFRRLMATWQNLDNHQLSFYVAYDNVDTYYFMGTVTATMMAAMPNNPMCQQLFSLVRQRAESVRFKIVDAADADLAYSSGQGPLFISLGLEISQYTNERLQRVPPAQRT